MYYKLYNLNIDLEFLLNHKINLLKMDVCQQEKKKKEANRHDLVHIEREIEALSCMTNGSLF